MSFNRIAARPGQPRSPFPVQQRPPPDRDIPTGWPRPPTRSGRELALSRYAAKLTRSVGNMVNSDFEALKLAGCEDGEILEVNKVCAYFNCSNRLPNGLGCMTDGDVIGYHEDAD